jgi:NAD(P)H-flavin reductase
METFERAPAACLYGVRHEADAFGFAELTTFCPNTMLAVSREQTEHHHGRLTELLPELSMSGDPHVYCCGLESMVNDASSWLLGQGVPLSNIHREVFFHG